MSHLFKFLYTLLLIFSDNGRKVIRQRNVLDIAYDTEQIVGQNFINFAISYQWYLPKHRRREYGDKKSGCCKFYFYFV